jgi:hypothetical protein
MSFSESLRQDLIDLFIQDCSQIRALTFQSYRGSGYSDQPLDLRSFLLAISLNSEQNPKKACTPVFKVWTTDSPQLPYENERYG